MPASSGRVGAPSDPATLVHASDDPPYPRNAVAWYAVAVLMLAYISSFIDRQILGLLVAPIRRDLEISDTQMSLLMGLAFALLYTVLGFPVGRLADSRSRRGIIAWGIAIWSVMSAACGLARTYGQLLLARVGVGVGEAALSPPGYSLIADYFPPHRLATALSVYSMGIYIGSGLANLIGGAVIGFAARGDVFHWPIVGEVRAWQSVFLVIGLPGLAIALLMRTVPEPPRRGAARAVERVPIRAVVRYLRDNARTFITLDVGVALISLVNYGTAAWVPSWLIRVHGWSAARAGVTLGPITMVFGSLGIVGAGWLADRLRARGRADAKMLVCLLSAAGELVTGTLYLTARDTTTALLWFAPFSLFAAGPFGAAAAAIQEISPDRMRAQMSALYLLALNLLGLGLGPTAVALMTDRVFGDPLAVGRSILVVTVVGLVLASAIIAAGLGAYRRTVARLVRD
jgi:MFS family permease